MPDNPDLEALATRIEREPPSRELDLRIHAATRIRHALSEHDIAGLLEKIEGSDDLVMDAYGDVLDYTTSIDAAASLVSDKWKVDVHGRLKVWRVVVWDECSIVARGKAATEPQARAAAALRARGGGGQQ